MQIEKDTGVLLEQETASVNKYPWKMMDVGDSFLVFSRAQDPINGRSPHTVKFITDYANYTLYPREFTHKKVQRGTRVWRVA